MSNLDEMFMHDLHAQKLHSEFRENKRTEEQIQELFSALGYENVPSSILSRLSKLSCIEGLNVQNRNSHFQDAVEISELIDNLVADYEMTESEMNELRFACLVHDVGKSGPSEATPEQQQAFVDIFNLKFNQYVYLVKNYQVTPSELTLEKALEIKVEEGALSAERAKEIIALVVEASKHQEIKRFETKITPKIRMGLFWSAHVFWTYDILRDQGIDEKITDVASSHHMIDGSDPARIGMENVSPQMASLELVDKYQAFRVRLILADKYQAFRIRGAKSHEETVSILKKIIFERLANNLKALTLYMEALELIDKNKEIFEKELDLA